MNYSAFLTIIAMMFSGLAEARVWTSVDGTKTFEGEFVSCTERTITITRAIGPITFKIELLAKEDQRWARKESRKRNLSEMSRNFTDSGLGKALQKLQKFDGDTFGDYQLENVPEFLILYYTSSEQSSCRASAPQMAKSYRDKIAKRSDMAFIHLSFDTSGEAATLWAKSFKQPWPTLLRNDIDVDQLIKPYFPDGKPVFPTCILIDRSGREITRGFDRALSAALRGKD